VTSSERKRRWRLAYPERSREAERRRAQARRYGFWDIWSGVLARAIDPTCAVSEPKPCASAESYQRYELSTNRFRQRLLYRRFGPGAHRLSREELQAQGERILAQAGIELAAT
jgi:hypothetical protein